MHSCPYGRKLKLQNERIKTSENGYEIATKYYCNAKCGRCPYRAKCNRSKKPYKTLQVNDVISKYRPIALKKHNKRRRSSSPYEQIYSG